jgi:hypothetical protein
VVYISPGLWPPEIFPPYAQQVLVFGAISVVMFIYSLLGLNQSAPTFGSVGRVEVRDLKKYAFH